MQEDQDIVSILSQKIQKVISAIEEVKVQNKHLEEENNNLKKQIEKQEKELLNSQNKLETLRMAKSVEASSEDSHDAKIKINRIVREIDKCIALLNR